MNSKRGPRTSKADIARAAAHQLRITVFLIDTPAIRNRCNSLKTNDGARF
jgi:hypothetical protein